MIATPFCIHSLNSFAGKGPLKNCALQNTLEECETILRRKPWIPSYDEWSDRLGLAQYEPYYLSESDDGGRFLLNSQRPLVIFPHKVNCLNLSDPGSTGIALPSTVYARRTADDLLDLGIPFLYGMTFRYLFDFSDRVLSSVPRAEVSLPGKTPQPTGAFTVAVHSRHTDRDDDGCNVTRELQCVERLLPPRHRAQSPSDDAAAPATASSCKLWVMADRECTLESMRRSLEGRCDVQVAPHDVMNDNEEEHGPFAGKRFWRGA